MRCVMPRVLPLPAPARVSRGPSIWLTASRCCALSPLRKSMKGELFNFSMPPGQSSAWCLVRLVRRERELRRLHRQPPAFISRLTSQLARRYTGPTMFTRRSFLQTAASASATLTLTAPASRLLAQANSFYRNPILGGDHPDASPIRVGNDFFLTHSSFDYAPGLLIWRSSDLVNWRPVAAALHRYYGNVYAPYLCEYEGSYYIYFPADGRLRVVHANNPTGPWSEPVDLGINAIDPAHIAENGRRFLYMAGGQMAELTPDGLAVLDPPRTVLKPWPIPATTRMECVCLEGPKLRSEE